MSVWSQLSSLQSGQTLTLTQGTYTIPSPVYWTNLSNVTVDGSGSTLTADNSSGFFPMFRFTSCTNITIKNMTINGNDFSHLTNKQFESGTQPNNGRGIDAEDANYVTLSNVTVQNYGSGGGILFFPSVYSNQSSNITVTDSTLISCFSGCILTNCINSSINGTTCQDITRFGMEFKDSSNNCQIDSCTATGCGYHYIFGSDSPGTGCQNCTISNCSAYNSPDSLPGVTLIYCNNCTIDSTTLTNLPSEM